MIVILTFLAVFAVLVFVHEWGHFFAAKKQGIAVEEFGFGFPPRVIGRLWRGTLYSLNCIPLGGFVRIKGEYGEHAEDADSFAGKPVWRRMIVVVAGVMMNVVLGWALLSAGFMSGFPQTVNDGVGAAHVRNRQLYVVDVRSESPAALAGVSAGDEILALNGEQVVTVEAVQSWMATREGTPVVMTLLREGRRVETTATPVFLPEAKRVALGVGLQEVGVVSYGIGESLWRGAQTTGVILREIIVSFYNLLRDALLGRGIQVELSGPVGIAVLTGQMADRGISYLLQFAALLSLNLAVLNALPIPALDGGRFVFMCIETLRKKPVSQRIEGMIHRIGFALLLVLVVFVTYKDILRFFT